MSKIPSFRNEEETIMKGTLKQTVNKFIFLFVFPLNILLIITNSFFMFSTYRQTKISTENMVNYFLDDIDSRLSTISFFLIKNGTEDPAFQSIAYDYVGRDYALEKIHLYQNLNSKIDLCPEIAYLFMFHSENNEMVIVPSSEYVSHGSYQAKETLCEMLKNPEQFLNASWTLITLQDQQFLLRLFKCNNAYLGVCVPTDSMIQKLKNYSFSNTAVTIAPTGTFTDKNTIVNNAVFYASLPAIKCEYPAYNVPAFYYTENWEDCSSFRPQTFFDISEGFSLWQKALEQEQSVQNCPFMPIVEYYRLKARTNGILMNCEYAEVFMKAENIRSLNKGNL